MKSRAVQNRCCEAILRIFESDLKTKRGEVRCPELENRSTKDVEVCARVGTINLAIEHTLIEPMQGFIEANLHFSQFTAEFDKLVPRCTIPSTHGFQLLIPGMALKRINRRHILTVTKAIADFASEQMPLLANPPPEDRSIPSEILEVMSRAIDEYDSDGLSKVWRKLYNVRASRRPPTSLTAKPDRVPFCVTLAIIRNPRPSQLGTLRVRAVVDNIEPKRRERVIKALKSKREKLERYRNDGYKTVLILESNDIGLTSDEGVFEALSAALSCVDAGVDDIFFADTCTSTYAFRHFVIDGQRNTDWYAAAERKFDANDLGSAVCG